MKFKNFSFILSILSLNLKVLSVPLNENELSFNDKGNSEKSDNVIDSIKILEDEIFDTLSDDDIDIAINVTDAIVEEEIDSDSDNEVESIPVLNANECISEVCTENSKRILNSLDISVNPCDDFYEFSCGGWIAENKDKPVGYTYIEPMYDKIKADLLEVLENDYKVNENLNKSDKEYDEKLFNIMKNHFKACVNNNDKVNDGKGLINLIKNFNINETLSKPDGITYLLADVHSNLFNIFFVMEALWTNDFPYKYIPLFNKDNFVENNNIYSSFLEVELSKEGLSYRRHFKNEDEYNEYLQQQYKIIDIYQKYIKNVLQTLHGQNENIDSMVDSIISVEKKFCRMLIDSQEQEDSYGEPIYSTESVDYEISVETEIWDYNYDDFDYDNDYDYNYDNTDYLFDEQNTDYEYEHDMSFYGSYLIDIKTLNEKYPLINWKLYFEKIFEFYGIEIPITEELPVYEDESLKYIFKYLEEINTEDLSIYIEWAIIMKISDYFNDFYENEEMYYNIIPKELIQIQKEFEKSKSDIVNDSNLNSENFISYNEEDFISYNEEEYENEEEGKKASDLFNGNDTNTKCLNYIDKTMPLVLSKYYADKVFTDITKSTFKDAVENIRNSMINRIKELEWLDPSTREYAMDKVSKIKYYIGRSDYIMNVEDLYNQYKIYDIVNENSDSIYLFLIRGYYYAKRDFNKLYNENYDEIFDINSMFESFMPSYILDAFYDSEKNTMNFPAAVLQSPNYDINQPDYINYGIIGSLIGHELTHAFDDYGKYYDGEGRFFDWWTDNDNEEFDEFSQCFINQYDNYSYEIEDKKYYVNGTYTLGENLADNGGLDRSFEAWKISIEKNPEKASERNIKLPGLSEYSMEQLFYISFAQSWCEIGYKFYYPFDVHSPNRFRVNGSVSNSKRFAQIFNCPAESPMNPDNKCKLW